MVLSLEPGLEISPECMIVHEENIVIEESGPRFLSRRAAAELPVLNGHG